MKAARLIALLTVAAACMAQAETNVVSSANVVGYVQRTLLPGKYTLIGVNFTASGGDPTLKEVVGTNQLKAAANYIDADRVVVWNPQTTSYQAYAQYIGDHEFYPCNTVYEWDNSAPTNPVISVGAGFWIISGSSTTNVLYLSGDVIATPSNTVDLVNGYQLVSWPFSADQAIGTISTTNLTKAANYIDADRIVVWEGDHYQQYGLYTDGEWYPCNTVQEWDAALTETPRVIALGEGFWFIAHGAKAITLGNPYYNNLQ
jgi:hypothetical protein